MHDFEPPVPVGHSRRKERKENIFLKALERCAFKKSCLTPAGVKRHIAGRREVFLATAFFLAGDKTYFLAYLAS
jgi:hypothetical protein